MLPLNQNFYTTWYTLLLRFHQQKVDQTRGESPDLLTKLCEVKFFVK